MSRKLKDWFCSCREAEFLQRPTPSWWKHSRQSGGMTGAKGSLSSLKATHVKKHGMGNKICKWHFLVSISNNSTRPHSPLGICNLKDFQKSPGVIQAPLQKDINPRAPWYMSYLMSSYLPSFKNGKCWPRGYQLVTSATAEHFHFLEEPRWGLHKHEQMGGWMMTGLVSVRLWEKASLFIIHALSKSGGWWGQMSK